MPTRENGVSVYTDDELARERACRLGSRCNCRHTGCYAGFLDPPPHLDDGKARRCPDCRESAEMVEEADPPPTRRSRRGVSQRW